LDVGKSYTNVLSEVNLTGEIPIYDVPVLIMVMDEGLWDRKAAVEKCGVPKPAYHSGLLPQERECRTRS
jgi:hypothetical protein